MMLFNTIYSDLAAFVALSRNNHMATSQPSLGWLVVPKKWRCTRTPTNPYCPLPFSPAFWQNGLKYTMYQGIRNTIRLVNSNSTPARVCATIYMNLTPALLCKSFRSARSGRTHYVENWKGCQMWVWILQRHILFTVWRSLTWAPLDGRNHSATQWALWQKNLTWHKPWTLRSWLAFQVQVWLHYNSVVWTQGSYVSKAWLSPATVKSMLHTY